VFLSRWFFDGSLGTAAWIAIVLLALFLVLLYFNRSSLNSHEYLLSAALLVTLLVSPYLYNYDFLLLLVPFAVLFPTGNVMQKIVVALCYLVPTFALILYSRNGNISLIAVSIVMIALLYMRVLRTKIPVIDSTARTA
jgi:hypothetical protein